MWLTYLHLPLHLLHVKQTCRPQRDISHWLLYDNRFWQGKIQIKVIFAKIVILCFFVAIRNIFDKNSYLAILYFSPRLSLVWVIVFFKKSIVLQNLILHTLFLQHGLSHHNFGVHMTPRSWAFYSSRLRLALFTTCVTALSSIYASLLGLSKFHSMSHSTKLISTLYPRNFTNIFLMFYLFSYF